MPILYVPQDDLPRIAQALTDCASGLNAVTTALQDALREVMARSRQQRQQEVQDVTPVDTATLTTILQRYSHAVSSALNTVAELMAAFLLPEAAAQRNQPPQSSSPGSAFRFFDEPAGNSVRLLSPETQAAFAAFLRENAPTQP